MKKIVITLISLSFIALSCKKDKGYSYDPFEFTEIKEDVYALHSVERRGSFDILPDSLRQKEPHTDNSLNFVDTAFIVKRYENYLCHSYDSILLEGNVLSLYIIDAQEDAYDGCIYSWEIILNATEDKGLLVRTYVKTDTSFKLHNEMQTTRL